MSAAAIHAQPAWKVSFAMSHYGDASHEADASDRWRDEALSLTLTVAALVCMAAIGARLATPLDDASTPRSEYLQHCARIADGLGRLACYDNLATPQQPAKGAIAPIFLHQPRKRDDFHDRCDGNCR